jgi:hypothetical protein
MLSQHRARIRTLTATRNEVVARAVADGVRISTVAAAVGESVPRGRGIAISFDDLSFEERTSCPDDHLRALRKTAVDPIPPSQVGPPSRAGSAS